MSAITNLDEFMSSFAQEGLTFDDVSLETCYSDVLPVDTDVSSRFSRRIGLNIPFVAAAMDTVTESEMAIALALLGGIGVIHKNLTPARQAAEVSRVKHYLNGLIADPVAFPQSIRVSELLETKAKNQYKFAGFPIVDDERKLAGIITARDIKFLTSYDVPVTEAMTADLITAREGTTLTEAFEIMVGHKVGKLPIVDASGRLVGLYSFSDVRSIIENMEPAFNRDEHHQLRVAAAVGTRDDERIAALVDAGVDALVVDTAHGHSRGVIETVRSLKRDYPAVDVVAGNIATGEGALALAKAGADAVKVGVGPGSICTTRVVAGVGVPQVTAVYRARKAVGDDVPVIADGGISYSGDAAKALAVGASSCMMGSALAGTEESPGERILRHGRTFVVYRGMGSLDAMQSSKGSRERYQADIAEPDKLVPQGIEGLVPYRGRVADVLHQFVGGLRYSLGYLGANSLEELRHRARLVRISSASLQEAHPHDVQIAKEAPNYQSD